MQEVDGSIPSSSTNLYLALPGPQRLVAPPFAARFLTNPGSGMLALHIGLCVAMAIRFDEQPHAPQLI